MNQGRVPQILTLAAGLVLISLAGCTSNQPATQPADVRSTTSMHASPASHLMARSTPVSIAIPKISVDSTLMKLGLKPDESLQVPAAATPAGWYTGSPSPGEQGPAVIVGHVHWNGHPGVFARLAELRRSDLITVRRADGTAAVFEVTAMKSYLKSQFPTKLVYGNVNDAELRLITCGGYDSVTHTYEANLVVFARIVS